MTAEQDELVETARRAFVKPFQGVIRLEPEGGAPVWIDGRENPPVLRPSVPDDLNSDGAGQCAWRASRETLIRILGGERLLASSYLSGRLAVAGDMSVMARLHLEQVVRG